MPERVLPPARHEAEDIRFGPMALAAGLLALAVAGLAGAAFWMFPHSARDRVIAQPVPRFAEPRLQPSPRADMDAFRAEQARQLDGAYWLYRERGVVHLPIAEAMRRVAAEGIPDWPATPPSPPRQAVRR